MNIGTVRDIARASGLKFSTVKHWVYVEDFPAPVAELSVGKIYDLDEVKEWYQKRTKDKIAELEGRL